MKLIFLAVLIAMTFHSASAALGQTVLPEGFNIYLLADDIKPVQLAALDIKKLKPVGEPVISRRDIAEYLKNRHEIRLFESGAERLRKLDVPTSGKSFIAFVGDAPVYTGAFWKSWSSQNFDGFAIDLASLATATPGKLQTIKIAEKYPDRHPKISFEDERQDDARSDARILNALERDGRLFEELQILGKCRKIVSTLTRDLSKYVTFDVTRIHKGEYDSSEITFHVSAWLQSRLMTALETKHGSSSGEYREFDRETEFFLKFERKIGGEKPVIVFVDFTKLPPELDRPALPAASGIARVEFEPGFKVWENADELVKALPRFVASEGAYLTRPFQSGAFYLKSGKILRFWSADKKSLLLLDDVPKLRTRRQLFVLPDEKAEDEKRRDEDLRDEDLFPIWNYREKGIPTRPKNLKWGFINSAGEIVIKPQFDDALEFYEGLAAVRVGDKWGFINRAGKIVIAPRWKRVRPFSDGLAAVTETMRSAWYDDSQTACGWIDRAGRVVIKTWLARACSDFYKGAARVCFPLTFPKPEYEGKCGWIDKTGAWAVEPQMVATAEIIDFANGMRAQRHGLRWGERYLRRKLELGIVNAYGAVWTIGDDGTDNVRGYRNKQGKYVWVAPGAWRLGAKWWRENYVGKQPMPNFPR